MLEEISTKFDKYQFGALKGRSATHELVYILHACHQAADNHQSIRAAFIDFAKAFDHVDHSVALNKMTQIGVQPFITRWMDALFLN
jgi:hypothetical protein